MKKFLSIILVFTMMFTLAACGAEEAENGAGGETDEPLRVALLISGTLGDKSFFDSANRGLELAKEKYGDDIEYKTVEMTNDETKWLPTLYDYSDEGTWDIIITGTWSMIEPLSEVAPKYPDQKYFMFDEELDYSAGEFDNVYSILYKQNEASFLAGALGARLSESNKLGFLGGTDSPVVNDFLVGYIEGAKYVEEDSSVVVSYVGNFSDTPKGKDLALIQYEQNGVDVGFNVAGGAGLGQIDAATQLDKFAIGVDSDQALELGEPSANHIPTSVLKNIDNSIVRAIGLAYDGKLPYGESENLGIAEGGIGLAKNEYYEKLVSEEIRKEIEEIEEKILNGEIEVSTAMGKSNEEIKAIRDSAK